MDEKLKRKELAKQRMRLKEEVCCITRFKLSYG